MASTKKLPQIVLFGASLTEWAFDEKTAGFGWVLKEKYAGKAEIVNEGQAGYTSTMLKGHFRNIIQRATEPFAAPTLLITIFLGANDACIMPQGEYVPLPQFEENIRAFVDSVLIEDNLANTKIVIITPPPVNLRDPVQDTDLSPAAAAAAAEIKKGDPKQERGYRTYMSKKRYAEKIMEIAESYEHTGQVIGLNLWKALIDAALDDQNRLGDEDAYDEERLPGCGLKWAKRFKNGYFTDGLHFGPLGYNVLSKELLAVTLNQWPELGPDKLEA